MAFTLVEVVVVLLLMGLAAALVAPSLVPRRAAARSGLDAAIENARTAAVRRGEVVRLRVDRSGAWRMDGAASADAPPLATGRVDAGAHGGLTLLFSPLGTCGSEVGDEAAAAALGLDTATCERRTPSTP